MNIPFTENEKKFITELERASESTAIKSLLDKRLKMLDQQNLSKEQEDFFKRRSKDLALNQIIKIRAKSIASTTPDNPPIPENWIEKHKTLVPGGTGSAKDTSYWEDAGWSFAVSEIASAPGNEGPKKIILLERAKKVVEQKLGLRPGISLPTGVMQVRYETADGKIYCLYCVNRSKLIPDYFQPKSTTASMKVLLVKLAQEIEEELDRHLLEGDRDLPIKIENGVDSAGALLILKEGIEIPSSKGGTYKLDPLTLILSVGSGEYRVANWKGPNRKIEKELLISSSKNWESLVRKAAVILGGESRRAGDFEMEVILDGMVASITPVAAWNNQPSKLIIDSSEFNMAEPYEIGTEDIESAHSLAEAIQFATEEDPGSEDVDH